MTRKRQGLTKRDAAPRYTLTAAQARYLKHRAAKRERRRKLEGETDE
jgi:hypothetical protein